MKRAVQKYRQIKKGLVVEEYEPNVYIQKFPSFSLIIRQY